MPDKSKNRLVLAVLVLAVLATYYYLRMRNCGCAIVGPVSGAYSGESMCAGGPNADCARGRWGLRYWQGDPDRPTVPQLIRASGSWIAQ